MTENQTAPLRKKGRPRKITSKAVENKKKLTNKSATQSKSTTDASVSDSEVVVASPKKVTRRAAQTRNKGNKNNENDKPSSDSTKRITRQTRLVIGVLLSFFLVISFF